MENSGGDVLTDEEKLFLRRERDKRAKQQEYKLRREAHRGPKVRSRTRKLELSMAAKRVVHTRTLLNHLSFMATGRYFKDLEDFV